VWPPYGRAAPLTLFFAMRRSPRILLMALLLAVVPIVATGCGGSEVSADEVPGPPPALTVPSDTELGGGGGGGDGNSDSSNSDDTSNSDDAASGDATATPTPEATTPPADTSGGTTAPETDTAPDDTATNDTPPAGAEAEQFESFCEQNAGAC
jgi:hypothetical protein